MRERPEQARRFVAGGLVALILLVASRPASSAVLYHHDLRSLFLEADAVVRAITVQRAEANQDVAHYRVVRAYQGTVGSEELIEVGGLSSYRLPLPNGRDPARRPTEQVLFLKREDETRWQLVPSGLRIHTNGQWQRFVQGTGIYRPVPQGWPRGVASPWHRQEPGLSDTRFEHLLRVEKKAADAVRAALRSATGAELAALCRVASANAHSLFRDTATAALEDRFVELRSAGRDLAHATERAESRGADGTPTSVPIGDVVLVARDVGAPTPNRVGALHSLMRGLEKVTAVQANELRRLLEDRDPEVRAQFLRTLNGAETKQLPRGFTGSALKQAVLAAWPREDSALVRVELLRFAAKHSLLKRLTSSRRLEFAGQRRGRVIDIRYAGYEPSWLPVSQRTILRHVDGGLSHEIVQRPTYDAVDAHGGRWTSPISSESLLPGTYRVVVEVTFVRGYLDRYSARMQVEDWTVWDEPKAQGPGTPMVALAPTSSEPFRGPAHIPPSFGCHHGRRAPESPWTMWSLVLGAIVLRRYLDG